MNEMRVLAQMNHPFIAKLHSALQDVRCLYFVLEALMGGEVFTHLRSRGRFTVGILPAAMCVPP
jgi:serine/threonine protein kinase